MATGILSLALVGVLVVPVERPDGSVQLGLRTWESLEVTLLPGTEFAEVEVIAEGVSRAWYAKTGHVVYVTSDGRVMARAFDPSSFRLGPSAVPLFDGVRIGVGTADIARRTTGPSRPRSSRRPPQQSATSG